MSYQENGRPAVSQLPSIHDRANRKLYWEAQGQPWRTEPEIDGERQKYVQEYLAEQRYLVAKGRRNALLGRADVEWILATHESDHGLFDRNDRGNGKRLGLDLHGLDLRGVDLSELPLANTNLFNANLERAKLDHAHLEDASLVDARLEEASLVGVHLEGAKLMGVHLEGADLASCYLNAETDLHNIRLFDKERGAAILVDVRWGDANLAVIDWSGLSVLGDERAAARAREDFKTPDYTLYRIEFSNRAARAYRQLAVVLRNQGITEDAARYVYRAQLMQRKVFWQQRKFGQYLFSLFLDMLTGYGYKPLRSFITYAVVISIFALVYFLLGPHIAWNEAIVISMTAFHGRGFFPEQFKPGDPQALVAAIEAFVGLLIEVTFIATLTQRLFGK